MADLKAIAQQVYDGFNSRDYDGVEALLHDDFTEHEAMPGMPSDKGAPRAFMETFTQSFPDMKMTVEDLLQDGDKVAARVRMTATHQGEFMGMPATGKPIGFTGVTMYRIEHGKIAEIWDTRNTFGILQQINPELGKAHTH